MVPIFARRAKRLGVDVSDLGIDATADEIDITCARTREIGDAIATRAKDPLFGFHAALEMPRGAYGLIEYVVRNTPTVRALIHQLVRFSRLINAQVVATFDDATGRLEQRIEGEPEGLGAQGNAFSLAHQVKVVRDACGVRVVQKRVYFAHAKSGDDAELKDYFGAREIVYASGFNGVDLDDDALATTLAAPDPSLFRVLETRAAELAAALSQKDDLENVRHAIARELETGEPTAKRVASTVGTSERTLHRRIGEHGTTFGKLVDRMRHDLALAHLRDDARSVSDVAMLLGYSDGRAFARAFRRWTKTTPLEWRRANTRTAAKSPKGHGD
jgi:AraC-like DNA-binding protein